MSYHDNQDSSKYLIYNLPSGDTSVVFYVRSKTPGFYPRLVYSLQFDSSNFTYPPDELAPYEQYTNWDEDLYSLKTTANFKGLPQRAFLIINLMYHAVSRQKSTEAITGQVSLPQSTGALAIITVSHTQITQLVQGEEYG